MYSKMMKYIKSGVLTFFVAIVTTFVIYGGYTIFAYTDVGKYLEFTDASQPFRIIKGTYHNNMNDYFNDKVNHLIEILEKDDFQENPDFMVPDTEADCTSNNVSTYCVSMGAVNLYIDYINTLQKLNSTIPTATLNSNSTLRDALNSVISQDTDVNSEIADAEITLKASLRLYDEFKRAYPMHIKYKEIIINLTKYKQSLQKITRKVRFFPLKFIDTTSSECR